MSPNIEAFYPVLTGAVAVALAILGTLGGWVIVRRVRAHFAARSVTIPAHGSGPYRQSNEQTVEDEPIEFSRMPKEEKRRRGRSRKAEGTRGR